MINRENKMIIGLMMLLCLFFTVTPKKVFATPEATYSVSPIFSEHQTADITNFFDISWTPGAVDTFGLKVTNNSDQEQTYQIAFNKAVTNVNGIIDYSNEAADDSTSIYPLKTLVKLPEKITVPAQSSQTIEGTVTFPEKDFNGLLLGGIHVSPIKEEVDKGQISNIVAYAFPFALRGNIDERPEPEISFGEVTIESDNFKSISAKINIQNKNVNLINNVKFKATIKNDKGKEEITQESQINITPETTFAYPIKIEKELEAGNYVLDILLSDEKENREWKTAKKFKITKEDAKDISEKININKPQKKVNWYLIIIGILVMAFLVVLLLLLKKKKNNVDY